MSFRKQSDRNACFFNEFTKPLYRADSKNKGDGATAFTTQRTKSLRFDCKTKTSISLGLFAKIHYLSETQPTTSKKQKLCPHRAWLHPTPAWLACSLARWGGARLGGGTNFVLLLFGGGWLRLRQIMSFRKQSDRNACFFYEFYEATLSSRLKKQRRRSDRVRNPTNKIEAI